MMLGKQRVLFVDDEVRMLNSLNRVLRARREEWDFCFESDPLSAISRARQDPFDLVVSDLRMPGMDGLEMIRRMRTGTPADAEYILLTGNADLDAAMEAINKTGLFRFLLKPCTPETLIDAIEAGLLNRAQRRGGADIMATAALSAMSPSVAVVDADARLVYANASARDVLTGHVGLSLDGSERCVAGTSQESVELQAAIRHASADIEAPPRFLRLGDTIEDNALTAVVVPVGAGRAAIVLTEPGRFEAPSVESLVELFGLTRVEARLARTIASGGSVKDAADACQVTLETARTYLKRIFQKMGVGRQADLVQLILSTPATLVRQHTLGR